MGHLFVMSGPTYKTGDFVTHSFKSNLYYQIKAIDGDCYRVATYGSRSHQRLGPDISIKIKNLDDDEFKLYVGR